MGPVLLGQLIQLMAEEELDMKRGVILVLLVWLCASVQAGCLQQYWQTVSQTDL